LVFACKSGSNKTGAAALAGAFGGLIAYGILHMDGAAGYAGWRWLYIIEGAFTILFGFACFWLLPNKPEDAYFLNGKDKENMMIRAEQCRVYQGKEEIEWRQVRSAFKEFKLYVRYSNL
jgi:MFS family permease